MPTCARDERLGDVQARVRDADWDTCVVLDEDGVVLGRIGRRALASAADVSTEEAMTPGPSTVRPSIGTDALRERIESRNLTSYLVTTSDGRLVGLVRLEDLE